ncbi:response regulator [Arcticibacter sp. MXS-1]|uniref:response regulator n=1 Tax=Arcticibacter sp. MXS-1 TaxID=3341726 RepID=UPI0035A918C0
MVFLLALVSYLSIRNQKDNIEWSESHVHVLNISAKIQNKLTEAESLKRDFAVTGRETYLHSYYANLAEIGSLVNELSKFRTENKRLDTSLDSVGIYLHQETASVEALKIETAESGSRSNDKELTPFDFYIEKLHKAVSTLSENENAALAARRYESAKGNTRTTVIIVIGSVMIFSMLVLIFGNIKRTFLLQKANEERIRDTNIQLWKISEENEKKNWVLSGVSKLDSAMRGELDVAELCRRIISELAEYTEASVALFYLSTAQGKLQTIATYAFEKTDRIFSIGEGLPGQVAKSKKPIRLDHVPSHYLSIRSGLGEMVPQTLVLYPIFFEGQLLGVIELGFSAMPSENKEWFIGRVCGGIGIAVNTAQSRVKLRELLTKTEKQARELESQQEELVATNEELLYKTQQLQASEEELTAQQEELLQMNSELEEKAEMLEERNSVIEKNREELALKAKELELSGKYKSEFLANMSHELRTPLNSILILARILKENRSGRLNDEDVKYAGVIANSGRDLLLLINDILDLSKIESGKLELLVDEIGMADVVSDMRLLFEEVAKKKEINFSVEVTPSAPSVFRSDKLRVEQILKNLLSNAFKFTSAGGHVFLKVERQGSRSTSGKKASTDVLAFHVTDSGIGIPEDKQNIIFESFKQADGSTSRMYGGTGLCLSISKELAHLLQGWMEVKSKPGAGSTFSLYLPYCYLDVVPHFSGKDDFHSPSLTMASASEVSLQNSIQNAGLMPGAGRPMSTPSKILVIEESDGGTDIMDDELKRLGFDVARVSTGQAALTLLSQGTLDVDLIVLDPQLSDLSGVELLQAIKKSDALCHAAVLIHTAMELDKESLQVITKLSHAMVLKGNLSVKRLLDEIQLLLSKENRADAIHLDPFPVLSSLRSPDLSPVLENVFKSKCLLIVDDDMRNIFALSAALTQFDVTIEIATNGREALEKLGTLGRVDLVLMDIMMPVMDGYRAISEIRKNERFKKLPVIALTAKAMKEDKARCIEIGANDYITKPLNIDQLLGMMKIWLEELG